MQKEYQLRIKKQIVLEERHRRTSNNQYPRFKNNSKAKELFEERKSATKWDTLYFSTW